MKRNLYITIISILAAVGCADPAQVLQAEAEYASVSLSSSSVVLENGEQTKVVFVASNREQWDAVSSADWGDVSVEGNSLTLYVDANEQSGDRMAVVDVVAGVEPDLAVTRLKVLQHGKSVTDLSKSGTANCYIAPTQTSYTFNAKVKGNGASDGYSFYINTYSVTIEGGAYAMLAWESTFDGDKTRSCDVIASEPIYDAHNGTICFSTGKSEGNALIALCDGRGKILWSWHIWVVDDQIKTSFGKKLYWMDRNLGALNNEVGDVANRGMLYQWGRKEPFLPSAEQYVDMPKHRYDEDYNSLETEEEYNATEAEIIRIRGLVNRANMQRGDGALEWQYVGVMAPVALQAPGNIEYAIEHPTTILSCRADMPIGEYVFDWYLVQDLVGAGGMYQQSQSYLWGNAQAGTAYKSIFDPCPPGYAVPPCGAFGTLNTEYACTYVSREWEEASCGWTWRGGNGDYFPSSGNLDVSGLIGETGERMLYWTAETFGDSTIGFGKSATLFVAFNDIYYGVYPILDPMEAGAWYSYGARCYAAPVRCVKEQKN